MYRAFPSSLSLPGPPSPRRSPRTSFGLLQFGFHPSHPSILHTSSSDPLLRGLTLHPCAPSSPPAISPGFSFFSVWCVSLSPRPCIPSPWVNFIFLFACNKGLHHIEGHLPCPFFCCPCWHPRTCVVSTTKLTLSACFSAAFT